MSTDFVQISEKLEKGALSADQDFFGISSREIESFESLTEHTGTAEETCPGLVRVSP